MHNSYKSPLSSRYASDDMQFIFSNNNKFRTWRKLWLALAKAQQKLGLNITDGQIQQLDKYQNDINYAVAQAREAVVRHDVMSHVYAYGQQAVEAAGIIHLGATSAYVGDNADIIIMRQALELVRVKLVNVIALLANFSNEYKELPTLGLTHMQPAQLTTVGKRATLWIYELYMDLQELDHCIDTLKLLGSKGATGTQASFLDLFDGDAQKVIQLDKLIAEDLGFKESVPVAGQTYSRKTDYFVLSVLSGVAQSTSKFSYDMRILQGLKEMEEPFNKDQIGSSAMPYKRNPMRCERITALSRYVMVDSLNPAFTAATQWFERTLDDSANRRIAISEGFLAVDAILNVMLNVTDGIVVYPKVIEKHVKSELPFLATENIMMHAVKAGGDRQELHERLRQHSQAAANVIKVEGGENDLIDRIAMDPILAINKEEILAILKPENYVGLAKEQTEEFLKNIIAPVLEKYKEQLNVKGVLSV